MRPFSFTRNLGGFEKVYDAIRLGYAPGITVRQFQARCGLSHDVSFLITEFFLCTQLRDGDEYIVADTLLTETIVRPFSTLLARLYFFALNLNMPGERLKADHRSPAIMQNTLIRNHLFVDRGFRESQFNKDQSVEPAVRQFGGFASAAALRKWVNNYCHMALQCRFVSSPDGHLETFADTWGALALRLFFERYVVTSPGANSGALVTAARTAELFKLIGVPSSWLDGRVEGTAEMFVADQLAVFEGFEESEAEREAARQGEAPTPGAEARRRETVIQQIIRRGENRRFLQTTYTGRCQLSGVRLIMPDGAFSVDCAHIRPLGAPHSGPDDVNNMLSLSPTMHRLFDRGCVRIDPATHAVTLLYSNQIPHLQSLLTRGNHNILRSHLEYHIRTILNY